MTPVQWIQEATGNCIKLIDGNNIEQRMEHVKNAYCTFDEGEKEFIHNLIKREFNIYDGIFVLSILTAYVKDERFWMDIELQRLMFSKDSSVSQNKRMPDYDYIHKELLRNGVSKKLLWTEYMEDCRANGDDPLMYSQFCYHIQQDEQKRRATMHINRKPGEQVEVDWAGDPATIIDPDIGEILKAYIFVGVMTYSQYAYVEALSNTYYLYSL